MRNSDGTVTVPPDYWLHTETHILCDLISPWWLDFCAHEPSEREAFLQSIQAELDRREGLAEVRNIGPGDNPPQRPRERSEVES